MQLSTMVSAKFRNYYNEKMAQPFAACKQQMIIYPILKMKFSADPMEPNSKSKPFILYFIYFLPEIFIYPKRYYINQALILISINSPINGISVSH